MSILLVAEYAWVTILMAITAYVLGQITSSKLRLADLTRGMLENLFLHSTIGLVEMASATFVLLLIHAFYLPVVLIFLVAVPSAYLFKQRSRISTLITNFSVTRRGFLVLVIVLLTILILVPLSLHPPLMWDSIEYHLPIASMNASSHFLDYNPYLREDFLPQLAEMLMSVVYLVTHSGIAVQLFNTYLFSLVILGIFVTSRRIGGNLSAFVSSAVFIGLPMALQLAGVAYSDVFLTQLSIFQLRFIQMIGDLLPKFLPKPALHRSFSSL